MDKHYFDSFRIGDYQRENFDSFLDKIHFSYNVPSIHISGSNGKGSTAHYIAAGFIENGYKTGLFHSPFLFDINEMITINGKPISDDDFMRLLNAHKKEIDKYDLSAFETQVYVALAYFEEQHCDIAVIECGMGGLIDATNIFKPVLSIITSVSLEHTDYLGHTLSEIAYQKAGIIKEKVPVLVGDLQEDALTVVVNTAKENKSEVHYLGHYVNAEYSDKGYSFEYSRYGQVKIQSLMKYSINDCVMALEALTILNDTFKTDPSLVVKGIEKVFMPCRGELYSKEPMIILDGAHNPEAMKNLCERSIYSITKEKPIHVVFCCFRDKNLGGMLSSLGEITDDLTLTTFDNPRARSVDEYFLFLGDYPFKENAKELIQEKINNFPNDAILVTGSLAFAAYVRDLLEKGEIKHEVEPLKE